jgi:hypothetical protein
VVLRSPKCTFYGISQGEFTHTCIVKTFFVVVVAAVVDVAAVAVVVDDVVASAAASHSIGAASSAGNGSIWNIFDESVLAVIYRQNFIRVKRNFVTIGL